MTKNEYLDMLIPELERLERVEHVVDHAVNGRYDEVETIFEECDYSSLDDYMTGENGESPERLEISDIPKEYLETHLIYLLYSGRNEDEIMENKQGYQEALDELGRVGKAGAEKMEYFSLSEIHGVAELMASEEDAVD